MARRDTCPHHSHPELVDPISEEQFESELRAILRAADVPPERMRGFSCSFPLELEMRHSKDARAYAEVTASELTFRFASQARSLPEANRLGLMVHEVGHVIDPAATENGADRAAEQTFGVLIAYDPRWPGKGLQRLLAPYSLKPPRIR